MPIYEYECQKCGSNFEIVCFSSEYKPKKKCQCGAMAKRIFTIGGPNCSNQDSGWIKQVLTVVDKDSGKPHCQQFLKDPTRENYKAWMKKEGLRPLESGEAPIKRYTQKEEAQNDRKITDRLCELHRKRNAISI